MEEAGLTPDTIKLELTESAILHDVDRGDPHDAAARLKWHPLRA